MLLSCLESIENLRLAWFSYDWLFCMYGIIIFDSLFKNPIVSGWCDREASEFI